MDNLHNINIEKAILSSILFDPESFDDILSEINSKDFYLSAHQKIYSAMVQLAHEDSPIDEEFIKNKLQNDDKFDDNSIVDILSTSPITNVKAYISELKELAFKRNLLTLATEIKKVTIEEDLPTNDIVDRVQSKLYNITQDTTSKDFQDTTEVTTKTLDYIKEMKAKGNSYLIGMDTGFNELNRMTSGFGAGDLIIIAARPSMGKTAFVLNIALKNLERDNGVAFFSLEMPSEQLMLRMLSAKTSIPLQNLRIGNLNDDQWTRLGDAVENLRSKKFFVDDDGNLNIHQLKAKLRKLKTSHPEVGLVIIDYLQLMNSASTQDRHQQLSEISRGLKMLARELALPIIALSQLNRSLESRPDKRPMMSDIRESGAIEQDADIIMFVYRDDVYKIREEKDKEKKARDDGKEYKSNFQEKDEEEAEIIIGKQRNGPTGIVNLIFQKKFTRFADSSGVETKFDPGVFDQQKETQIDIPDQNGGMEHVPIL
jgi:replicative DNA helicase